MRKEVVAATKGVDKGVAQAAEIADSLHTTLMHPRSGMRTWVQEQAASCTDNVWGRVVPRCRGMLRRATALLRAALPLLVMLAVFVLATHKGRRALLSTDPLYAAARLVSVRGVALVDSGDHASEVTGPPWRLERGDRGTRPRA